MSPVIDVVLLPSDLDVDCGGASLFSEEILDLQKDGRIIVYGTNLYPTDIDGNSIDGRANYGPKVQAGFLKFGLKCTVAGEEVIVQVNTFSADMYGVMEYNGDQRTFVPAIDITNHTVEGFNIKTYSWTYMVFKSLMDIIERRVQYNTEESSNKNPKYVNIAQNILNHTFSDEEMNNQLTPFWELYAQIYTLQRLQKLGVKKVILKGIEEAGVQEYFKIVKTLLESDDVGQWADKVTHTTPPDNTPLVILTENGKEQLIPNSGETPIG